MNLPPSADDEQVSAETGNQTSGTLVATDDEALTYSISAQATNGTAAINSSTGAYTYTPNVGYSGDDSFVILVSDGSKSTNVTIWVTITDPAFYLTDEVGELLQFEDGETVSVQP